MAVDVPLRAAAVSGADVLLRQGTQVVIAAILARLLTPADFGVVAMASAIVAMLMVVVDLGVTPALIRDPDLDDRTLSTAFWLTLGAGLAIACALFALAGTIENLTAVHGLGVALRGLVVTIPLGAVAIVPAALIVRRLHFGRLAIIGTIAAVVSGLVGIVLAARGAGFTALVVMAVTSAVLSTTSILLWSGFRPRALVRRDSLRALLGMGRFLMATTLLEAMTSRLPVLLVGHGFGSSGAGQYSRAENVTQTFTELTNGVIGRVSLPVFARNPGDKVLLVQGLRTGFRYGTAVSGPVMLAVSVLATPLAVGVFGNQWVSTGAILSALAVGAMVWPIHVVAVNGLVVQGLARQVFLLDVQKRIIFLVLIVLAVAVSPVLTAWAVACASLIAAAVNMSALARYADYPLGLQIRDVTPVFLASCPWAALAWFLSTRWSGPPLLVAAALFAGIGVMTVVTAVSLRIPVVREMTQRIKAAFRA